MAERFARSVAAQRGTRHQSRRAGWLFTGAGAATLLAGAVIGAPSTAGAALAPSAAPLCQGERATLVGDARAGDRVVVGTQGRDVIMARGVRVEALGGDDLVCGSSGREVIIGGKGNDRLYGGGGADLLYADVIGVGIDKDQDEVVGGGGPDRIWVEGGSDKTSAGAGDDVITAKLAPDVQLDAGPGDDQVKLGSLALSGARVTGGPGADRLSVWSSAQDWRTSRISIDLGSQSLTHTTRGASGTTSISAFEEYAVSDADLTFVGSEAAESLIARDANSLEARMLGGDDIVLGTRADDVIDAGEGRDDVNGAGGTDRCVAAEVVKSCEVLS